MILVTGGAGYIGSHCVLALLEKGYSVCVFDNLSTGHMETIETLKTIGKDSFKFIKGNLLNYDDINSVFENNIDAVIHFAAFSQVGESVENPMKYYTNNVYGTMNLLNAMIRNNVKKIVFSSTAATYGEPIKTPIDENHPQNPINPYGQTKLMIEKIMDDYDKAYDLKSVRLRYFNVIGADSKTDKSPRVGESHDVETHLVPNILISTYKPTNPFKIFGTDYSTKDGTCIRDYINVEDLSEAHLLALDYLNKGGKTDFFNLGTCQGYSVWDIFDTCKKVTNKDIQVITTDRRAGDPAILVADNNKAKNILGWTPTQSLDNSIQSAYKWVQKTINNKEPNK